VTADVRRALQSLHGERVVHGAVDPQHVVVGPSRAVLCIAMPAPISDRDADWAGLDAMGGRSSRA
jgi:hypothetical protein